MKRKLLGATAFLVVLFIARAIGGAIGIEAGNSLTSSSWEPTAEKMAQVAENTAAQQQLPKMLDGETEWYDVTGSAATLTYHYRLVNYTNSEIDGDLLLPDLRAGVLLQVCKQEKTQRLLEKGISSVYTYSGRDGGHITRFKITPSDCNL